VGDHGPPAVAGLDQAAGLQRPRRLAHGEPADPELHGEVRLGGERRARLELLQHEALQPLDHGIGDGHEGKISEEIRAVPEVSA
jgi:hypothetical protein